MSLVHKRVDGQFEKAGGGRTDERALERGVGMQDVACASERAVEKQEASFSWIAEP